MSPMRRVFVFISTLCLILLCWKYEYMEGSWNDGWIKLRQEHSDHQITVNQTLPQNYCTGEAVPFDYKLLPVNGTKTLLVSAYQEHRTHRREVRVIAVVLTREKADYHCYLCCDGKLHHAAGMRNLSHYQSGYAYGAADIMCPIPSSCGTVSHIAVTSTDAEEEKKFLEVRNKRAKKDSFPYNFTVCYSVMHHFDNVLQLLQSLEMLQILGVNKVAVYVTSKSPEIKHLLNYYIQKSWADMLPVLEQQYGLDGCYTFENHEFPSSIRLPPPSHQTLPPESRWDKVPGVNILAHLYKKLFLKTSHVKMIVNPRIVFSAMVHGLKDPGRKCILVKASIARMYHTRHPREKGLKPGDLIYDGRLLNYSAQLTSAVNNALRESGLLPLDSRT